MDKVDKKWTNFLTLYVVWHINHTFPTRDTTKAGESMEGRQLEIRFDEIEALEAEITAHQDAYQAGKPTISDADYDKLVVKLETIKPNSKALERIGKADGKIQHEIPMLSLQKAYDIDTLYDWVCRYDAKRCMVSFKLDGIACSLVYRHGKLVQASTRGNGLKGMDITANIMQAGRIPQSIRQRGIIEIRGELILTKADIADLGINVGRSAVAGAVSGRVSEVTRRLQFVAYDIAGNTHHEPAKWRKLAHLGFELPKHARISWEELEDAVAGFDGMRESYHYETDGIVFKIEDAHKFAACGFTKHHPKGAIAYKWPQEASESILEPQTCENTADDENARIAQNTANNGQLAKEIDMGVKLYVNVNESALEEFDFTSRKEALDYFHETIEWRSDYNHRVVRACIDDGRTTYDRERGGRWRPLRWWLA